MIRDAFLRAWETAAAWDVAARLYDAIAMCSPVVNTGRSAGRIATSGRSACLRIAAGVVTHLAVERRTDSTHAARGFPADQSAAHHRGQQGQRPGDEGRRLPRRFRQARDRRTARATLRRAAHPQQGQRRAQRRQATSGRWSTSPNPSWPPTALRRNIQINIAMAGAKFDTLVRIALSGRLPTKFFVDAGERISRAEAPGMGYEVRGRQAHQISGTRSRIARCWSRIFRLSFPSTSRNRARERGRDAGCGPGVGAATNAQVAELIDDLLVFHSETKHTLFALIVHSRRACGRCPGHRAGAVPARVGVCAPRHFFNATG